MSRMLALTGATGFIGRRLISHLTTAGWTIRALERTPGTSFRHEGVDWVAGSLDDPESLARLLDGVDGVVHCAGAVRGASPADFAGVNSKGVGRIAAAAGARERPPFFVLISSLAAREPQLSDYARSKREGELALEAAAGSMPWVALRPPVVYGPGDREVAPLFAWMARGIAPVPANGAGRFSLLYVDDLAEAVNRCLANAAAAGRIFELHDGRRGGYEWCELIDEAGRHFGRRVRRLDIPVNLLRGVSVVNLAAARLFRYAPMLTPGKVREICHAEWVCDNRPMNDATGWVPRVELARGLTLTCPRR